VDSPKPKVTLILGAGFSREAGLPDTQTIAARFLHAPLDGQLDFEIEQEISHQLRVFWEYAFNYDGSNESPSLEDHFTILDLAANTGRNIGSEYPPNKLRAIRRFSIHRIFQILALNYHPSPAIETLLRSLDSQADLQAVVSTNWDRVVENHLRDLSVPYWYGVQVESLLGVETLLDGTKLLMLHGSANWIYCDCCRRLFAEEIGKSALEAFIYITRDDFRLLCKSNPSVIRLVDGLSRRDKRCSYCESRLSARIATFSYRKEISIPQFQTVWQQAFSALRDSDAWLFIGYSLPDADFEFRHLLKSAEKAVPGEKNIRVILKGDGDAGRRFTHFFGLSDEQIYQGGFSDWMRDCFADWLHPPVKP
jgi:NAD-dependent SIR2 family protein deacetylase